MCYLRTIIVATEVIASSYLTLRPRPILQPTSLFLNNTVGPFSCVIPSVSPIDDGLPTEGRYQLRVDFEFG